MRLTNKKVHRVFCYNLAMIIDFHTHILPPRIKEERSKYIASDPCFAALYSDEKARLATADELIASMDEHGVDISVVLNLGWTSHELCVETNDYILESVARFPERLIGFGSVQPQLLESALAEIERCAKGGIKGIGEMRPDIQLLDLKNEKVMEPFIKTIISRKLILLTHISEPVGHQYPGKGDVTPELLYPFITRYPDLTLVCAHWGGGLPFYALMPEVKKALGNVFFDTAASPFLYNPQIYSQVIQLVGTDKILFGSDYPLLSQSRLLREIKSLDLSEETKNLILSGNAQKLLGIKNSFSNPSPSG
ncbi:MAG: amidohydrolase family protein [Dehalococcoidales bacterium]|nr:amidohydrolase family protein [Dehalococcoidales bacterium]